MLCFFCHITKGNSIISKAFFPHRIKTKVLTSTRPSLLAGVGVPESISRAAIFELFEKIKKTHTMSRQFHFFASHRNVRTLQTTISIHLACFPFEVMQKHLLNEILMCTRMKTHGCKRNNSCTFIASSVSHVYIIVNYSVHVSKLNNGFVRCIRTSSGSSSSPSLFYHYRSHTTSADRLPLA